MLLKGIKRYFKEGKIDKLDNEVKRGLLVTVKEHKFDHPVPSWPKLSSIVWYKNSYFSEERMWGEGLMGFRRAETSLKEEEMFEGLYKMLRASVEWRYGS